MDMPRNGFKNALAGHGRQVGLWLGLADAYCAEICAGAGFDWLLIDGEHAPNDVRSILHQLQAIAPYPVHPVVRASIGDPTIIKQLLDVGAQTLLVPMVDSAEQARRLVSGMRYPPAGTRGVGSALARASRWNGVPDYLQRADAEVCLLVQIETKAGLENASAIAAVEGVDGVFVGPADLAGGLGHLGDPGHPEVQDAIDLCMRRIHAAGKPSGTLTSDEALAKRYLALGCTFVAVGLDTSLLARAARQLARAFSSDVVPAPGPGGGPT
jgi:4-hydroxy-2-oxoheptanedioate aldolase